MDYILLDSIIDGEAIINNDLETNISNFQKWLNSTAEWFTGYIPNLITAAVILFGGYWLIKLIVHILVKALGKSKADHTIVSFLSSVTKTGLYICLFVCVLSALRFDVSTLIAALGAAVVTVGLALKDNLANVASGTLIILNRKFKTGDFIEIEGIIGEVMHIDMMHTTLRTYDHKEVLIPNSRLTSNNLINHFKLEARRIDIVVPIKYGQNVDAAKKAILDYVNNAEFVLHDRDNMVFVENYADSSIDLKLFVWCRSEDYWPVYFDIREGIKKSFDRDGIEIPFNQLDIHIDDSSALTKGKDDNK